MSSDGYAEFEDVEGVAHQTHGGSGEWREVNDDVGALGGGEGEKLRGRGGFEQALVVGDDLERGAIGKAEAIEAAVGAVHNPKAVLAGLDLVIREQLAVGEDGVAEDFGNPGTGGVVGDGIDELAIAREQAVRDEQWDFILPCRKVEGVFARVADDEQALQSGVDVEPVYAHGVVVIEEQRSVLGGGVEAGLGLAWGGPGFGIAVAVGWGSATVEMHDGAGFRHSWLRTHEGVVNGKEMARGEMILPVDDDGFAAFGFDGGSGKATGESPHAGGRQIAMDAGMDFGDGNTVERNVLAWIFRIGAGALRAEHGRDGQRVDEGS